MKLSTLLSQFAADMSDIADEISRAFINGFKAKYDPSRHPRDRMGRWTRGGATVGMAYDADKGVWVDENGDEVPKKIADRLAAIKMPKNMIGVKLNPDPKHNLQAVGYYFNRANGTVGSFRYFYSENHKTEAHAKKFMGLKKFDGVKKKLATAAYKDALKGSKPAGVVFLMDQTAIRVGSGKGGGRTDSGIGCCDLKVRHVKVNGNKVSLNFIGKSGVKFKQSYTSAKLATVIQSFLHEGDEPKGRNDSLFGTTDDTVRSYMRKTVGADAAELKPHHYRYWHGTRIATEEIEKLTKPNMKKKKDVLRIKKSVCEKVAKFLNNTPAVAFQQYIDPAVWRFIPENIDFTLPKHSKSVTAFQSASMDDLFDMTVYPEFEGIDAIDYDYLFADIAFDEEYTETEEDRKAYKEFVSNGEGFPEQ